MAARKRREAQYGAAGRPPGFARYRVVLMGSSPRVALIATSLRSALAGISGAMVNVPAADAYSDTWAAWQTWRIILVPPGEHDDYDGTCVAELRTAWGL